MDTGQTQLEKASNLKYRLRKWKHLGKFSSACDMGNIKFVGMKFLITSL
jgi:hypothetical protein